jgi:hypothetical protein
LNDREIVVGKQICRMLDSINRGDTLPISKFTPLLDTLTKWGQEHVMRAVRWDLWKRRGIKGYLICAGEEDEPSVLLSALDDQFKTIRNDARSSLERKKAAVQDIRSKLAHCEHPDDEREFVAMTARVEGWDSMVNRKEMELNQIFAAHQNLERACINGEESTPELEAEMKSFMHQVNEWNRPEAVSPEEERELDEGQRNLLAE